MLCGLALTLALLAWALRGVSPAFVWSAMQSAHVAWLGLALISFLASLSLRARRWGSCPLTRERLHERWYSIGSREYRWEQRSEVSLPNDSSM